MVTKTYTVSILCPACNGALDMTEDRKCRKCGHDFGPPPPPDTDIRLPDMDYHWIRPGAGATLDGWFTAEELRRIADAIDGNATQVGDPEENCPRRTRGDTNYRCNVYPYCNCAGDDLKSITARLGEAERDARRYRWLKRRNPGAIMAVAYQFREACVHTEPDAAVDAAMATDWNSTQESPAPEVCPRCQGKGTEVLVDYTNDRRPITHVGTCTLCHGLKWQQP